MGGNDPAGTDSRPSLLEKLKKRAQAIRVQAYALALACRDPRTPMAARVLAVLVVAYAFSPIDLVPDFIPVLGYLDDLILIPLGIALALRMIPAPVMDDARRKAGENLAAGGAWAGRLGKFGAAAILLAWLSIAVLIVLRVFRLI